MNPEPQKQVVIVQSPKNPGIAAILGFFLGPIGLLYVGILPAVIMFVIVVPVAIVTFGFGLLVTEPSCAVVGYLCAQAFNKKLLQAKSS